MPLQTRLSLFTNREHLDLITPINIYQQGWLAKSSAAGIRWEVSGLHVCTCRC